MKIGITTRYIYENGIQKQFVNSKYIEYIETAGFIPVILPINCKSINELLDICDCFLITGGEDIDASWYNMKNHITMVNMDINMDILDKTVIEYSIINKKPVLGICRGMQAINVFLGGTLHQDIINHKGKANNEYISFNGNGVLFSRFNNIIEINSYHHQAIDILAKDLINCGISNNIIEAVEHRYLPIFAVQWHPEKINDANNLKIILEFKEICKKYKRNERIKL